MSLISSYPCILSLSLVARVAYETHFTLFLSVSLAHSLSPSLGRCLPLARSLSLYVALSPPRSLPLSSSLSHAHSRSLSLRAGTAGRFALTVWLYAADGIDIERDEVPSQGREKARARTSAFRHSLWGVHARRQCWW